VLQLRHHPLPYPHDAGVRSMPRMCSLLTVHDAALGPVRVMTTHLEYFSKPQRMAQALALRALHLEAAAQAARPPQDARDGSPFQAKPHTPHAVLCGDFNLQAHEPEYAAIAAPLSPFEAAGWAQPGTPPLHDAWRLLRPAEPQPPTFCLFDRTYAPEPVACDFVWVSDSLKGRVRAMDVDVQTQASDHQPVLLSLG
jgi:endonuclease/exonuclease/phosphatase family metal-dependent hydrolase